MKLLDSGVDHSEYNFLLHEQIHKGLILRKVSIVFCFYQSTTHALCSGFICPWLHHCGLTTVVRPQVDFVVMEIFTKNPDFYSFSRPVGELFTDFMAF